MLHRKTRSRSWKGVAVLGALPHFVRSVCQVPTPFQRSETTTYLHHDLTLHTNLQFALVSLWEPLLVGGCAATVFAVAVQPPFFMLSFCLLIGKSLLTSPLVYPTTIIPLNHIKSVISSVFPSFHCKTPHPRLLSWQKKRPHQQSADAA